MARQQPTTFHRHLILLFVLSAGLSLFTAFNQHMNNYLIFDASFSHLVNGTSLYVPYPDEHNDLFKYSPTFALFMGLFSWLPLEFGATLWNLLGAGLFALALINLPVQQRTRKAIFWISLPEFIGSTQGFQSNIHIVSLLVLFWLCLENKRAILAAFCILATFFIKIFGIVGLCLLLFSKYSNRDFRFLIKFVLSMIIVGFGLMYLPIIVTGWEGLKFQYLEWAKMLKNDAAVSYGFSVMGIVFALTQTHFKVFYWQVAGGLAMVLVFMLGRNGDRKIRLLGLIAITYFLVAFNHKSESPTFIIPMVGFGIHQSMIKNPKLKWSLIAFTLLMVSAFYSDLFPREFKQNIADVYAFKAWPFMILLPMAWWQILQARKRVLAEPVIQRKTY